MEIITVKTRPVLPPKDDLFAILDESLPVLHECDVVCVTSKIVAIHQGRTQKIDSVVDKDELIAREADHFIPRSECPHGYVMLTIKNKTLIATAGIDESNANGHYILWPEQPDVVAVTIRQYLKKKFNLGNLAVVITDSHSLPLRRGVVGMSIGFSGLRPMKNYVGKKDIFGRPLHMTKVDVVDALATIGVLAMGEGAEQTPIAILRGAPQVECVDVDDREDFAIPTEEDIFYPLLKRFEEFKK